MRHLVVCKIPGTTHLTEHHPKDMRPTVQDRIIGASFVSFTLNKNRSERAEPQRKAQAMYVYPTMAFLAKAVHLSCS